MHRGFLVFRMRIVFWLLFFFSWGFSAETLAQKYPSFSYVLSEFDIERDYIDDERFIRFVKKNEKRLKQFYRRSVKEGEAFVQMVRSELLQDGLSDLFLYLSIAESGLSAGAVSPKSAAGLWQFMPKTAQYYNLNVCYGCDERYDPFSSTKAAIAHLNRLHQQFGKWYLAVMAYNCGEGRMQKAIAAAGTDELEILLDDEAKYLPRETREYMRKILFLAMIGESDMIDFASPEKTDTLVQVKVAGGMEFGTLAKLLGMKRHDLESLNKMFVSGKIPSEKPFYNITIPESKMARFYLCYTPPETKTEYKSHLVSHTVALGETLEYIAVRYHTRVDEIKAVNRLEGDMLEVGALLLVPVSEEEFDTLLH